MQDRNTTLFGWILGGGIVALGLSIGFGNVFHTENPEGEKMGYFIEDTAAEAGGDAGRDLAAHAGAAPRFLRTDAKANCGDGSVERHHKTVPGTGCRA